MARQPAETPRKRLICRGAGLGYPTGRRSGRVVRGGRRACRAPTIASISPVVGSSKARPRSASASSLGRRSPGPRSRRFKLAFIGPLTGGTASNGLGGRNSFLLAVQERNADPRTKYHYETEVLDDECKPTVAVQAALKAYRTRRSWRA